MDAVLASVRRRGLRAKVRDDAVVVDGVGERIEDLERTHARLLSRGWDGDASIEWLVDGLLAAHRHRRDAVPAASVRWKLTDPRRFPVPWAVPAPAGLAAYPVRDELDRTERLTGAQIDDLGGLDELFARTLRTTLAEPAQRRPLRIERFDGQALRGDVYTASRLLDLPAMVEALGLTHGPVVLAVPAHTEIWTLAVPPATDWREAAWAVSARVGRHAEEKGGALCAGTFLMTCSSPIGPDLRPASRIIGGRIEMVDDQSGSSPIGP